MKIRVVHTIPMGAGGISNLTLTINEKIDRERFEFNYLVFRDQREFCDDRAKALGSPKMIVNIQGIKNPIIKGLKKIYGTAQLLKEENIEIIHVDASTPYDVILAVAAKKAGVKKIIFHAHNDNFERKLNLFTIMQPLFRVLIPMVVTDYIAISEQAANFMFPKKIVKSRDFYLFKNGIDIQKYIYNPITRKTYREKYKLTNRFVVGHIGRFVYQKNHEFLIDIFYQIRKKRSDAVLILIGIGELETQIRDKVKENGLADSVMFWGITNDVPNILQAMDCFVFPSRYEGLGMSAIEAQCAGLPTITSDVLPKEVEITECIKKISLDKPANFWAETIISFSEGLVRCDNGEEVRKAGYDINDVVVQLEKLYST